jgi:hypothetical protein
MTEGVGALNSGGSIPRGDGGGSTCPRGVADTSEMGAGSVCWTGER